MIIKTYKKFIVFILLFAFLGIPSVFASNTGKIVVDYTYGTTAINSANFNAYLVQTYDKTSNTYKNTANFSNLSDIKFADLVNSTNSPDYSIKYNEATTLIQDYIALNQVSSDRSDFSVNSGFYTLSDVEDGLYYIYVNTVRTTSYKYSSSPMLVLIESGDIVEIDAKISRIRIVTTSTDNEDDEDFEEDFIPDEEDFSPDEEDFSPDEQDDILPNEDDEILPEEDEVLPEESLNSETFSVAKIWEGDFSHIFTPVSVSVTINCNGELYEVVTLSDENSWYYEWESLDPNNEWTILELSEIPNFYVSYYKNDNDFTIINTYDDLTVVLPQTGTFANLIPIFAGIGVIFISTGVLLRIKLKND